LTLPVLSSLISVLFFFFFFQAEDGIRDGHVTGVQTCALPIFLAALQPERRGVKCGKKIERTFVHDPSEWVRVRKVCRELGRPGQTHQWNKRDTKRRHICRAPPEGGLEEWNH